MATDPALATDSATVGLHYQLHGYVGPHGAFRPSPFEGWATFPQVMGRRPDSHRFAIVRGVPLKQVRVSATRDVVEAGDTPVGDWLVWDLDAVKRARPLIDRGLFSPPDALWSHESVDALVMKCIALYDVGE